MTVEAVGYGTGWARDSAIRYVNVGADPFPKITYQPSIPAPDEEVEIDASESYDPDGEIVSYNWSYYNTETPENIINLGDEKTIHYSWDKQGIYNLILFIEDDKGNNNTIEKKIVVSILNINILDTFSRKISFNILNKGKIDAKNVYWNIKIEKNSLSSLRYTDLYKNGNTIYELKSKDYQKVEIKNLRRAFCKIKINITAEAQNAVSVSKTLYGIVFGKFVYLTEEDFLNPYTSIAITGVAVVLITLFLCFFFSR